MFKHFARSALLVVGLGSVVQVQEEQTQYEDSEDHRKSTYQLTEDCAADTIKSHLGGLTFLRRINRGENLVWHLSGDSMIMVEFNTVSDKQNKELGWFIIQEGSNHVTINYEDPVGPFVEAASYGENITEELINKGTDFDDKLRARCSLTP